jgi:hypothetical protein
LDINFNREPFDRIFYETAIKNIFSQKDEDGCHTILIKNKKYLYENKT